MSSSTEAKETQSTIQLDKLLSVCLDTATKASAIIRDVMASGRNVSTAKDKSEHGGQGTDALDPQTEADLRSQHLIVASLSKMYPNLNIVGEEGKLEYKPECAIDAKTDLCSAIIEEAKKSGTSLDLPIADVCVWVDPLDGTREFTEGIKEAVTTLVGISLKGKAIAGVVYQPFVNQCLWGGIGLGVHASIPLIPKRKKDDPLDSKKIVCTSRSHMTPTLQAALDAIKTDDIIKQGGAGAKSVMLLTGKANCYYYPQAGTKKWDTCAVQALVEEHGGVVTDGYGNPLTYFVDQTHSNENGIIATININHSDFLLKKTQ